MDVLWCYWLPKKRDEALILAQLSVYSDFKKNIRLILFGLRHITRLLPDAFIEFRQYLLLILFKSYVYLR